MTQLTTPRKGDPRGGRGPNPGPHELGPPELDYGSSTGRRHSGRELLNADRAPLKKLQAGASRPAIARPLDAPPKWFEDMTCATQDLETLVAGVFERTLADPNHERLAEAEAILNELGRDPKAAAIITTKLKAVSIADIDRGASGSE